MAVEKLRSISQITGTDYMRVVRRCCNPICSEKATWVSHEGRFIWCTEHAPWEEF